MSIDLHTHSSRSDGTSTPAELVAEAARAGVEVLGITDHDTAEGWPEAAAAAASYDVSLVRGIEISTSYDGRSVHLLAYLPDPDFPPLADELVRIRGGREGRLPAMVERLRGIGIAVSEDDVRAAAAPGAVIGRPHVADALVSKGLVAHRDEAFETLLGPGGPGFVPRYATGLFDAVSLVRRSGGVAVVAHPWGRNRVLTPEVIADLRDHGLTGLEVDHQDHDLQQRDELRTLATGLGLVVTGSSDFHGAGKLDHELGCNTTSPDQLDLLLTAAAESAVAARRPAPEPLR